MSTSLENAGYAAVASPLTERCKTPRRSRAATKALGLDPVKSSQSLVHQRVNGVSSRGMPPAPAGRP